MFREVLAILWLFAWLPCAFWGYPHVVKIDHRAGGPREWVAILKRDGPNSHHANGMPSCKGIRTLPLRDCAKRSLRLLVSAKKPELCLVDASASLYARRSC